MEVYIVSAYCLLKSVASVIKRLHNRGSFRVAACVTARRALNTRFPRTQDIETPDRHAGFLRCSAWQMSCDKQRPRSCQTQNHVYCQVVKQCSSTAMWNLLWSLVAETKQGQPKPIQIIHVQAYALSIVYILIYIIIIFILIYRLHVL